jgi:hypothetical protein
MARSQNSKETLARVRSFPSPPEDFDPLVATDDELLRHGLPRRPDRDREPALAAVWRRAFSRPLKFIQADAKVDPVLGNRSPLPVNGDPATFSGARWAGMVKLQSQANSSDFKAPSAMVMGQFQLPYVAQLAPNEDMTVAFWVGLDGAPSLDAVASKQVLQCGVAAHVDSSWFGNGVKWYPWFEWYTELHKDPPVLLANFPVHSGDVIFALVCAAEPDYATISMLNVTRGVAVNVGFAAPPGITVQGHSAEWIVEIPTQSPHTPYFSPVAFTDCAAGSLATGVFRLDGALPFDIRSASSASNPYGTLLTKVTALDDRNFVVQELGVDW